MAENFWEQDEVIQPAPAQAAGGSAAGGNPWDDDPIIDEGPGLEIPIIGGTRESDVAGGAPAQAQALQPTGSGLARDLGMSARSVIQGAGSLIGAVGGDAFNHYLVPGEQPSYRDAAAGLADRLGLPAPETGRERVMGDIGEALTGTGLTMGLGAALNAGRSALAAPSVRTAAAGLLTAQPKLQAVSAAAGAGAAGVARESGAGEGTQLAAGLVGGLAPGAGSAGAAATLRGAVRGRSGEQMRRTIDDFAQVGATPSVGQASGNWFAQGMENLLAGGPTSAGVMNRFAERQADDIGAGLRTAGASLSRRSSGEDAGRAIQRGIHGPDGFTAQYKEAQRQLYDAVDEHIPAGTGVDLSNTRQALAALNAPIEGAPNTSRLFQNSRIQGIEGALNRDLAIPTEPQKALDDALVKLDGLYASRNSATQDSGRFAAYANDQANAAQRYYPVDGMPRFPGRYTPAQANVQPGLDAADEAADIARARVSSAQQIESTLGELQAAADAAGGRLPYEAIKKLRTLVGNELDDAGLASDLPRSKFKALYAALSKDLEGAASEAGPDAMQAFRRANNYTRAGHERVDAIAKVIDRNGGPEAVFNAVMAGTRDGATTLRAVMQSIPKDAQRSLTAAVIKRMGMPTPGQAGAEAAEEFSASTFLTNWNRVSPEARRALFDRHGPGFTKQMDRIARVAANLREGSKVFSNPSGTTNRNAAQAYAIGLPLSMAQAPFTGHYWPVVATIGGGVAANVAARAMTHPGIVKWLAHSTVLPRGSIVGSLNALRSKGERDQDPDVVEFADALLDQQPESAPQE